MLRFSMLLDTATRSDQGVLYVCSERNAVGTPAPNYSLFLHLTSGAAEEGGQGGQLPPPNMMLGGGAEPPQKLYYSLIKNKR